MPIAPKFRKKKESSSYKYAPNFLAKILGKPPKISVIIGKDQRPSEINWEGKRKEN